MFAQCSQIIYNKIEVLMNKQELEKEIAKLTKQSQIQVQPFIAISNEFLFPIVALCLGLVCGYNIYIILCFLLIIVVSIHYDTYLSKIEIYDNYIVLYCKFLYTVNQKIIIHKKDIKNFNISLSSRLQKSCHYFGRMPYTFLLCETKLSIQTIDSLYQFNVKPCLNFQFCDYAFFLKVLDNAKYIPNFSKTLDFSSKTVYMDIKYYLKHKKQLPLYKRIIH